jgi:hypothetical protein
MVDDRQKLFDYWKNIPSYEFITVPEDKYYSHLVRRNIVRLLRKGIEDESPDRKFSVRHALNVSEINQELKKLNEPALSKTTLYFHLDISIELGLIFKVATLHEGPYGRNKTKYFGRVARNLFVSSEEHIFEKYNSQYEEFQKIAKILDFKLPDNYSKLPKEITETHEHFHRVLGEWLIKHEELIEEKQLNMGLLYDFLKSVNYIHPAYINLLTDLFNVLQQNIQDL